MENRLSYLCILGVCLCHCASGEVHGACPLNEADCDREATNPISQAGRVERSRRRLCNDSPRPPSQFGIDADGFSAPFSSPLVSPLPGPTVVGRLLVVLLLGGLSRSSSGSLRALALHATGTGSTVRRGAVIGASERGGVVEDGNKGKDGSAFASHRRGIGGRTARSRCAVRSKGAENGGG